MEEVRRKVTHIQRPYVCRQAFDQVISRTVEIINIIVTRARQPDFTLNETYHLTIAYRFKTHWSNGSSTIVPTEWDVFFAETKYRTESLVRTNDFACSSVAKPFLPNKTLRVRYVGVGVSFSAGFALFGGVQKYLRETHATAKLTTTSHPLSVDRVNRFRFYFFIFSFTAPM